jgi:hypothetical protein
MLKEDRYLLSREDLEDRVAVMVGGRAVEQLVVGTISTGESDDTSARRSSPGTWSPISASARGWGRSAMPDGSWST